MGKKGKGRQSSGFGSKALKAGHDTEVNNLRDEALKWTRRETAGFVAWSNALQKHQRRLQGERPKFSSALRRNLNGILSERQALRSHQLRERRRRNGFLPRENVVSGFDEAHEHEVLNGLSHCPGWLLCHDIKTIGDFNTDANSAKSSLPSLQSLALKVFAHYIREYLSAMGYEGLFGALSILSPETITDISIILSSGLPVSKTVSKISNDRGGARRRLRDQDSVDTLPTVYMDNTLAMLLGQQPHVEKLCFRSRTSTATGHGTLTSVALESLIPRNSVCLQMRQRKKDADPNYDNKSSTNEHVPESWEDDSESSAYDESADVDWNETPMIRGSSGCNLRMRRLELLDLNIDSTMHIDENGDSSIVGILLRWFEKCSGITHLSLAGSFHHHHEVGRTILLALPRVLPSLEVLDVTRCAWATDSILARLKNAYYEKELVAASQKRSNNQSSDDDCQISVSCSRNFMPAVYYYRGEFEWLPDTMKTLIDQDVWDDANTR